MGFRITLLIIWMIVCKEENRGDDIINNLYDLIPDEYKQEDQLKYHEYTIMKIINYEIYALDYMECLRFILFDNCLLDKEFKSIISITQSKILK